MLNVQSLACRRGLRLVFREVNLTVGPGALMLIAGANGSGKSTLLRVLAGLLPSSDGAISWNDKPVDGDADAHRERLHYIGHLDAVKPELTVGETLDYWRSLRQGEAPADFDDPFSTTKLKDKPVRYLSAGQKRRVALTRLMQDFAPLWLLDEPTTALDQEGQRILSEVITQHRAKGGMVIAAMHHALDLPDVQHYAMPEARR